MYLDLDENKDSIIFQKHRDYQYVEYDYEKTNVYNQTQITFLPKKNDLLIFSARLLHQIGPHLSTNHRICLAFEVFAKGVFGKKNILREFNRGKLILK